MADGTTPTAGMSPAQLQQALLTQLPSVLNPTKANPAFTTGLNPAGVTPTQPSTASSAGDPPGATGTPVKPFNVGQQLTQMLQGAQQGQVSGPGAQEFANQIWALISGLPASQVSGSGGALAQIAKDFPGSTLSSDLQNLAQSGGASATGGQGGASTDDVLTQGMNMFFSKYLAPMLTQTFKMNQAQDQYGAQAVNQALNQPNVPPGLKAAMQPIVAAQNQGMNLMNEAGLMQTGTALPFQSLMTNLTNQTAATQAVTDAATKALTYELYGTGNPAQFGAAISQAYGPNSLLGLLASLTGGGGTTPGAGTTTTPSGPTTIPAITNVG